MKPSDFLTWAESLKLDDLPYKKALEAYKTINEKRLKIDKLSTALKVHEDNIKDAVINRMKKEDLTTLKTSIGRMTVVEKEIVTTYDNDQFIAWLEKNPKHLKEVLSKKPYTQSKIKEFDSEGALPPGLKYFREAKLSITSG